MAAGCVASLCLQHDDDASHALSALCERLHASELLECTPAELALLLLALARARHAPPPLLVYEATCALLREGLTSELLDMAPRDVARCATAHWGRTATKFARSRTRRHGHGRAWASRVRNLTAPSLTLTLTLTPRSDCRTGCV